MAGGAEAGNEYLRDRHAGFDQLLATRPSSHRRTTGPRAAAR